MGTVRVPRFRIVGGRLICHVFPRHNAKKVTDSRRFVGTRIEFEIYNFPPSFDIRRMRLRFQRRLVLVREESLNKSDSLNKLLH